MQEYGRVILTLLVISLLPSCGPHSKKIRKAASQRAASSMPKIQTQIDVEQSVVELEAKLIDIPTAIGSQLSAITQVSEQPYQLRVTFECAQNLAELDAFYTEQMAYHGWQAVANIASDEPMQIYKKPHKICVITFVQIVPGNVQLALVISEVQNEI